MYGEGEEGEWKKRERSGRGEEWKERGEGITYVCNTILKLLNSDPKIWKT